MFDVVLNIHLGGVLILVKLQALTLLRGCFSCFLNCTNGTKSRNPSHLTKCVFYPLVVTILFPYPRKTLEKLSFSDVFRRYRKRSVA